MSPSSRIRIAPRPERRRISRSPSSTTVPARSRLSFGRPVCSTPTHQPPARLPRPPPRARRRRARMRRRPRPRPPRARSRPPPAPASPGGSASPAARRWMSPVRCASRPPPRSPHARRAPAPPPTMRWRPAGIPRAAASAPPAAPRPPPRQARPLPALPPRRGLVHHRAAHHHRLRSSHLLALAALAQHHQPERLLVLGPAHRLGHQSHRELHRRRPDVDHLRPVPRRRDLRQPPRGPARVHGRPPAACALRTLKAARGPAPQEPRRPDEGRRHRTAGPPRRPEPRA